MQEIVVKNLSTAVSDADLAAALPAFQTQVSRDFAASWGVDAKLVLASKGAGLPVGTWLLGVFDNSDQASALGYHDVTSRGDPLGKVFAKTTKDDGGLWTVTFSHELLEVLADPGINLAAIDAESNRAWAYEACFTADTLVALADGSTAPIASLVGRRPLVRSFTDGRFVAAQATCRRTALSARVVRVSFADGTSVVCTPNHRFLTRRGWVEAELLCRGEGVVSDVRPTLPLADLVDGALGQAMQDCDLGDGCSARADREGYVRRDLAHAVALASVVDAPVASHATLLDRVQHVLAMRSKKEMFGIAARRVVASMANKLTGWYFAAEEFVRQAVSEVNAATISQLAVAGIGAGPGPQPALPINFSNARLEQFAEVGPSSVVGGEASGDGAMAFHPRPVRSAKPFGTVRSIAAGNGAHSHYTIIDAVEDEGHTDVFDLTVTGFGNFTLANGAVVHNCDAVEADELGYDIDGTRVSDFVLPSFFEAGSITGVPRDFCGHVRDCFELAPGGYLSYLDLAHPTRGWQQITAQRAPTMRASSKSHGLSRHGRRGGAKRRSTAD